MSEKFEERGMGWLREPPDLRDYSIEITEDDPVATLRSPQASEDPAKSEKLKKLERSLNKKVKWSASLPPKHFDNVKWCSPIEDQGALGSCTAQAGVGLLEYFERRAFDKHLDASRSFLYKVTRNLLGLTGDTGAYCRTTMGAMVLFGVPPEKYRPYDIAHFDEEPTCFLYALAQNFQSLIYHKVDCDRSVSSPRLFIAHGLPLMFGFRVYESYTQATPTGEIPYPSPHERPVGGHAVVAVGYDDGKVIKNQWGGVKTKGALLIRNSWGTDWGCKPPAHSDERGYGWLPYEYVEQGLAVDWWSLIKAEWIDTGHFGL